MAWSNANKAVLAMGLVAALLFPAATASSALSYDFHDNSCPNLLNMVYNAVDAARQEDPGVVPGLLRITYHDCFPQGCDGSILLTGPNSEQDILPQNAGLQQGALDLIESIRAKVHRACGPTVSCADITNLATREAVLQSGLPRYEVPLGRRDSIAPARRQDVEALPRPDFDVHQLVQSFRSRGLDETDLVALSGAHTIGEAGCGSFENRFSSEEINTNGFVKRLLDNCTVNADRRQDLDVTTPMKFDNKYFTNLYRGIGVLSSDMALLLDVNTRSKVKDFAGDQEWFFRQFSNSMSKLAHRQGAKGNNAEIRNHCFERNNGGPFVGMGFKASA